MNFNIIQDRAFDVVCAKRAGLNELSDQILARLNATYPELQGYAQQCITLYGGLLEGITKPRSEWLIEHKDKLRLRYR